MMTPISPPCLLATPVHPGNIAPESPRCVRAGGLMWPARAFQTSIMTIIRARGPDPDPRNYHLQHVILTFGSGWLPQKSAQTLISSLQLHGHLNQKWKTAEKNLAKNASNSSCDDHLLSFWIILFACVIVILQS